MSRTDDEATAIRFMTDFWGRARQLRTPDIALRWFLLNAHLPTPITAATAAMWANLGYLPEEARPLIEAGDKPWRAARRDGADLGPADAALTLVERTVAAGGEMVIDPDLADRLGL